MRARADLCKRMAISFGPTNSEIMREAADLWHRLAADAEARAANPLRPLGVSLNGRRPGMQTPWWNVDGTRALRVG
jgi:hypothetical protein